MTETMVRDIRYGIRSLRKVPGFALIAVVTLALGIGANTAMFSIVNGVLLRPIPFTEPDRLVKLYTSMPQIHLADAGRRRGSTGAGADCLGGIDDLYDVVLVEHQSRF